MKFFFNPLSCPTSCDSFSPSWKKPAAFLQSVADAGIPHAIVQSTAATEDDLICVHSPRFVQDVLRGTAPTGFGAKSVEVARSCQYTVGAMRDAAVHALTTGESVCAPVSGFHHSGYAYNGGFCTFNGLMVAAAFIHDLGGSSAILDFDMHYGDGTDDILRTFGGSSLSVTAHYGTNHAAQGGEGAAWLSTLAKFLVDVDGPLYDAEVWLYQAGADIHVDDPLGGLLTTEQMFERDRMVFAAAKEAHIPVVWNLAGGYQDDFSKVLALHLNTVQAFSEVYGG